MILFEYLLLMEAERNIKIAVENKTYKNADRSENITVGVLL